MPFTIHIDSNRTWGGGQEQSLGLAQALAERGERTYFIAQSGSALASRLAASSIPWESMPLRGFRQVAAWSWLRLSRRFRQLRPDIVHVHDSAAQIPALWAAGRWTAGKFSRRKPRVIVTRRNDTPIRSSRRAASYQLLCDRVICVSNAVRQRLVDAGVSPGRLVVIPDFVDCRRFDPAAVAPAERSARPTIVSVGRLSSEKGHSVVIQAMPGVKAQMPEARLVICGSGPQAEALRQQIDALGLSDSVDLRGFVADVRPVLAAADVVVVPSLSEGLGVAALEAMAMARAVIASNTGGLPESVVDGQTGIIVPPGDAGALAEAVVFALRDPERARALGEAGRARALALFDREAVVDRILSLYTDVLAGS